MVRWMTAVALGTVLLTAACGKGGERRAEAEARAAKSGFVPPAVTSRLDYGGEMERRFRALDRNGDDELSEEEWPRQDSRLQLLDRNKDGVVTHTEFSEGMLNRFDQMDLNRDGTVTSEEERSYREMRARGQLPNTTQGTTGPLLPGG